VLHLWSGRPRVEDLPVVAGLVAVAVVIAVDVFPFLSFSVLVVLWLSEACVFQFLVALVIWL
jgi:hypothetical protein